MSNRADRRTFPDPPCCLTESSTATGSVSSSRSLRRVSSRRLEVLLGGSRTCAYSFPSLISPAFPVTNVSADLSFFISLLQGRYDGSRTNRRRALPAGRWRRPSTVAWSRRTARLHQRARCRHPTHRHPHIMDRYQPKGASLGSFDLSCQGVPGIDFSVVDVLDTGARSRSPLPTRTSSPSPNDSGPVSSCTTSS